MNLNPTLFILSYIIGAFPTGTLVARYYGVHIHKVGSGNTGATNVARTLGKKAGIITLIGDAAKGAIPLILAHIIGIDRLLFPLIAFSTICGHCLSFPPFLKGGKGVATTLGCLLSLNPLFALIPLGTFIGVFGVSRIVSLASIVSASAVILSGLLYDTLPEQIGYVGIGLLVIIRHTSNIKRLLSGVEGRFALSKSSGE
jgi:acyl phosphate:glycerol-3-phosphate acyltransferase